MTRYGMFCQMLPDRDGNVALRMGSEVYDSQEAAQHACDQVRRQNLPFRAWPFPFEDPRPEGMQS